MKDTRIDSDARDPTHGKSGVAPRVGRAPANPAAPAEEDRSSPPIQEDAAARSRHWQIRDIDYEGIDCAAAAADEALMAVVASASIIESAPDIYTADLVGYYSTDSEVGDWLTGQWEPEELQHGQALRAYVARVWPSFDLSSTTTPTTAWLGNWARRPRWRWLPAAWLRPAPRRCTVPFTITRTSRSCGTSCAASARTRSAISNTSIATSGSIRVAKN